MAYVRGFPPICRSDARILVLGSMPSRESLARSQYYAHPRNGFWPIMADLLSIGELAYGERVARILDSRIAVWDVLQACFRSGSLDSAIDDRTVVTNDFASFFAGHPDIRRVFFNGSKAEQLYRRHVLPRLSGRAALIPLQRLPSTSPAHAGMTLEQKKAAWRAAIDPVTDARKIG